MIRRLLAIALITSPLAAASAQSDEGPPRWAANLQRKQHVIMNGLPSAYGALADPTRDTAAKLQRGAAVFTRNCASCHGWSGQGTGPEAFALVPAPADLEWLRATSKTRGGRYMYWSIAEGGQAFESDMPAYKQTLSKRDIWAVIAYIRAGLPQRTP